MDKKEAKEILEQHIQKLREISYADLTKLLYENDAPPLEVTGKSGVQYNVDIQVFWDDENEPNGNLRVIVCIYDDKVRWFFSPLSSSFIMAPNGSFIDEKPC